MVSSFAKNHPRKMTGSFEFGLLFWLVSTIEQDFNTSYMLRLGIDRRLPPGGWSFCPCIQNCHRLCSFPQLQPSPP